MIMLNSKSTGIAVMITIRIECVCALLYSDEICRGNQLLVTVLMLFCKSEVHSFRFSTLLP